MAKTYNCPSCDGSMTTVEIKDSEKSCPHCGAPLKHVTRRIEGMGGGKNHFWISDPERPIPKKKEKIPDPKYKRITTGDNPEIWRLVNKSDGEDNEMDFQVVYWDRISQTALRCPKCGGYMHTTNAISGVREETLCRSQEKTEDGWRKCKTRTRFIFLKRGQSHEIIT